MSTTLKEKLYSYEVAPPASAWEGIVSDLDDSMLSSSFPRRLQESEAIPPPASWALIAASLQADGLSTEFPETLYNREAIPPAGVWNKVAAALAEDQPEKLATGKVRSLPFLRYAAAAILLISLTYGAFQFFGNKGTNESNDLVSTPPPANPVTGQSTTNTETPGTVSPVITGESADDAALEASKNTYAALDAADRRRLNRVAEEMVYTPVDPIYTSSNISPQSTYRQPSLASVASAVYTSSNASLDMANRYAMVITPDGQIIRISRKLGTLVCCVSGEEVDDGCVDNLKVWRQRIADSPLAPAPGNFLDILSMLQTFKDNTL